MEKENLDIIGITIGKPDSDTHALLLGNHAGKWHFPIPISIWEGQNIAMQLEAKLSSRPHTYDLIVNMLKAFHVTIEEVCIHRLEGKNFLTNIICRDQQGEIIEIDARVVDAVTIAIKNRSALTINKEILETPGLVINGPMPSPEGNIPGVRENILSELNRLLNDAIKREDYEQASLLRDEIKRRSKA